jgi:hypothetical protein
MNVAHCLQVITQPGACQMSCPAAASYELQMPVVEFMLMLDVQTHCC